MRELYHRTKNNMQVIMSILTLQTQNIEDEHILQMFKETVNRIKSMAIVHEKLYQTKDLSRIDLKEYFIDLISFLSKSHKLRQDIKVDLDMDNVSVTIDIAIPCGLILNELFANSLKHAFPDGRKGEIRISLKNKEENDLEIMVGDDGIGLPEGFNYRQAHSFGLQSALALVEHQLRGTINVNTAKGLVWQIRFKEPVYMERI